jgi:hypothetical protein
VTSLPTGAHWGKVVRVRVGKKTSASAPVVGVEFTQALKITFDVTKTIYRTPNVGTIKLYNLSEDNENHIHDEFNDVELDAGYAEDGGPQGIFRGNIRYVYRYREGNDRITEIQAGDGDKDWKDAEVNFTLAGGHTDGDAIGKMLESLGTTTLGYVAGTQITKPHILGKTYSGTVRQVMDVIARNNKAHWAIQDGKLVMVPFGSTMPNEAIKVDSTTGLLGAPQINDKGISMKLQLDPSVVPNGKLWLSNNEVKAAVFKAPMLLREHQKKSKAHVRLDPDGVYKVLVVNHKGDTRGNDWYSEIMCIGLDAKIPTTKSNVPMAGLETYLGD